MFSRKKFWLLGLGLIYFLVAKPLGAATTRFSAFQIWPSVGDKYYFVTSSTQGLYQKQFSFDISNSFVYQPLVALNLNGTLQKPIVDYFVGHFFSLGYGLTDFWQLGVTVPIFSQARVEDPTIAPSPGLSNVFDIGDLRMTSKVRLVNPNKHQVGVALEPFVHIPLGGADAHYLGESKITAGGRLLTDVFLTERILLSLNLGVEVRTEQVLISNINFSRHFLGGLGLSVTPIRPLTFSAELQSSTSVDNFYSGKNTVAAEYLGSARWQMPSGVSVGVGGGSCIVCGARASLARGFVDLGYRWQNDSLRKKEEEQLALRQVTFKRSASQDRLVQKIIDLREKCPRRSEEYRPGVDDEACLKFYKLREEIVSLGKKSDQEKFSEVILDLKKNCPGDPSQFDPAVLDASCPKFFALKEEVISLRRSSEEEKLKEEVILLKSPQKFDLKNLSAKAKEEKFAEVVLGLKKNCPKREEDFNPETHDISCKKYFKIRDQLIDLGGTRVVNLKKGEEKFAEVLLALKKNCPSDPSKFDPAVHDVSCPKFFEIRKKVVQLSPQTSEELTFRTPTGRKQSSREMVSYLKGQDRDHDGIPDVFDECPNEPEDKNGIADSDGCPETSIHVSAQEVWTVAPVYFGFNRVDINAEAAKILSYLIEVLGEHSEITTLEVIGYTDILGTPAANRRVSLKRAKMVIEYLRQCGLSETVKLFPLGVGSREPVATNKTPQGRYQNRRVIFRRPLLH